MALICKLLEWKDDSAHSMPEQKWLTDQALHCGNPKCICNNEKVHPRFKQAAGGVTRCWYCDAKVK